MNNDIRQAAMALLEKSVSAIGSDVRTDVLENGVPLLSFITPMYDDGTGLVLFQVSLLREQEEWDMVQIVSILQPHIGEALPHLEQAVARWNLNTILGAYGVYYAGDQLYHKCRQLLAEDAAAENISEAVMDALVLIYDEIARRYSTADAMVASGLTFQQAQQRGLC